MGLYEDFAQPRPTDTDVLIAALELATTGTLRIATLCEEPSNWPDFIRAVNRATELAKEGEL